MGIAVRPIELTAEHVAAAARRRRIIVNLDTGWGLPGVEDLAPERFVQAHVDYLTGTGACPSTTSGSAGSISRCSMRSVREMLQELGRQRGRPYLLATRVPENLEGCHWDALYVERWVDESQVDILALGCKSFEVDLNAFRCLTSGSHIRLYPSLDDHHRAGGYERPSIELYRGAASTFLQQGADGNYAFNWYPVPAILDSRANPAQERMRRQALCEMGSLETLRHADKVFTTQRRGGGGWSERAEYFYKNSSAFAQLPRVISPASIDEDGQPAETYIAIAVGDDVDQDAEAVERVQLRLLLSDAAAEGKPWESRIHTQPVEICTHSRRPETSCGACEPGSTGYCSTRRRYRRAG